MPIMDGYELALRLRYAARTERIHLIAIAGYGGEQHREKSRAAGFATHLLKPIDFGRARRDVVRGC